MLTIQISVLSVSHKAYNFMVRAHWRQACEIGFVNLSGNIYKTKYFVSNPNFLQYSGVLSWNVTDELGMVIFSSVFINRRGGSFVIYIPAPMG